MNALPTAGQLNGRSGLIAGLKLAVAVLAFATAAHAQLPPDVLNSERIEARFGGFGIDVLEQSGRLRISDLWSADADSGARTTRTLAVVAYPEQVDASLSGLHAGIIDGASIGATFRAAGWQVLKTHLHYGVIDAPAGALERMGLRGPARLAAHVYRLDVRRAGQHLPYAHILEVHHPDYLGRADLPAIYGSPSAQTGTAIVSELLAAFDRRFAPAH